MRRSSVLRSMRPKGRQPSLIAEKQRFQQLHGSGGQGLAREGAADPDQALIGEDLDDGVQVVVGLEVIDPAAADRAAGEARQADGSDLHGMSRSVFLELIYRFA